MRDEDKKKHVNERQLVVFKLGSEEFGLAITKVNSIIKMEKITKIPNSEVFVEGVINLRGKIIVVVNLHKKLGLAEKEWNKDTRIIVVELKEETVGLIVDEVREVLRIDEAKIEAAPEIILEKIDSDYIEGVGILNERLIVLLEVDRILHKHELESVKKTTEREAEKQSLADRKGEVEAPKDQYFWFNNGKAVKSVKELIDDLRSIDDDVFRHHVNEGKNDFSEWIKNVMNDPTLAEKIRAKIGKAEMIEILEKER